jgi:hypothetical protein
LVEVSAGVGDGHLATASTYVKEICIPSCGDEHLVEDKLTAAHFYSAVQNGGLFRSVAGVVAVRLFPALKLGITLRLSDQDLARLAQDFAISRLGPDSEQLYTLLAASSLLPFEIRLTTKDSYSSYYVEGSEAVLDGTIGSLQSKRVLQDGDAISTEVDERINNGHCWAEVREMSKRSIRVA